MSSAVDASYWANRRGEIDSAAVYREEQLRAGVEVGTSRCDGSTPVNAMPATERIQAAAAARRLDDAFRQFLNERGERALPLAEATRLVTVVAGIRLAADAVVDLWSRETEQPVVTASHRGRSCTTRPRS